MMDSSMPLSPVSIAPVSPKLIESRQTVQQQVLWIGCSCSGFEETTVLDLQPDEMIVMRNIGNMVLDHDFGCDAMVRYAVNVLRVKHVVVCGHYGCGIVKAGSANTGLKDPWLSRLSKLREEHVRDLESVSSTNERDRLFVELNIVDQMHVVEHLPEIANAIKERGLKIHGLVFDRGMDKTFEVKEIAAF